MNYRQIARAGGCYALRALRLVALLAAAVSPLTAPAAEAMNDVVLFKNADRLTGEIKYLGRGKLSFDAPASGVIELEWDDIAQLISKTTFDVTLESGERLYGSLVEPTRPGEIRLQTDSTTLDLPIQTVVGMTPIESSIIDRINMSIDLGYSLAKANQLKQMTVGYDVSYRDEKRLLSLSVDGSTASSDSAPSSTRVFSNLSFRRFLASKNWDPIGVGQFERNDELAIDKRASLGGGMGRWLRDTNQNRIAFSGGLIRTFEDDVGSTETTADTEAMVGMDFEWFRYDEPELDVSTKFTLYKRLSGTREPRGNLDVNFRWEIFKDFFWGFSFYYTFDKQTTANTEPTSDYGSFVSLGWKL